MIKRSLILSDNNEVIKQLSDKYSSSNDKEKLRMLDMILNERKRLGLPIPERFKSSDSD